MIWGRLCSLQWGSIMRVGLGRYTWALPLGVGEGVAESIPGSFPSLRRVYVVNKEICVRTVCAHEELLRGRTATSTPLS